MRVTNQITQGAKPNQDLSTSIKKLILGSIMDKEQAARLASTIIGAVMDNPKLKNCSAEKIVSCALKGEGMGLQYGRDYAIIPYGTSATFVMQKNGMLALLLATREVADVDSIDVREGELLGRDKRTRRPNIDFSVYKTEEEREQHPIIGYLAYVELLNGYFRFEYMTVSQILDHAERYVRRFSKETYLKLAAGEMDDKEAEELQEDVWYGHTEAMMKKTVLRKLLQSGYVPLANTAAIQRILNADPIGGEGIIPDIGFDPATGEVVDETEKAEQTSSPATAPEKPRGRKAESIPMPEASENSDAPEEDVIGNFFGE